MSTTLIRASASTQSIKAKDLQLVLIAAKMRRHNKGRTCQMAVLTSAPVIEIDCSRRNRMRNLDDALSYGYFDSQITPLHRGHISQLYMRTRLNHGLAEVKKTWGVGLKALQAEPRHVLNGGAA